MEFVSYVILVIYVHYLLFQDTCTPEHKKQADYFGAHEEPYTSTDSFRSSQCTWQTAQRDTHHSSYPFRRSSVVSERTYSINTKPGR